MVGSAAPGSKNRSMGTITLEVFAAENSDVESTNNVISHAIVGSQSFSLLCCRSAAELSLMLVSWFIPVFELPVCV